MARKFIRKPSLRPVEKPKSPLKGIDLSEINYKNLELLRQFVGDRGKIKSRELTGVTVQEQRRIVNAIKNARELALLPFVEIKQQVRKPRTFNKR